MVLPTTASKLQTYLQNQNIKMRITGMLTFVKQKINDRCNRSENMTVHHVQNIAHVINIGGAGGRGGIYIWYCRFDIAEVRINVVFYSCRVWSKET